MRMPLIIAACAALVVTSISTDGWSQGGTYGGGVIAPGSPPMTLSGTSGGPRQARSMGSQCRGTIAARPDHVFRVSSPMTVHFEVLNASGDTTMVIVGPSGTFCDDDSGNGFNPRIIQHLMPGRYRVFIGSYSAGNLYPYTLRVQGQGVPMPPPPTHHQGGALFGNAVLGPGQMTAVLSGTSGGPVPARNHGPTCRGHITAVPGHLVTVHSPMVLNFNVQAPGDTTLVVVGPGGTFCDDDGGNGFNPRVTRPLQPGTYQVFVGTYSSGRVYPYTLSITP
jgi:hypothetical protein